MYLDSVQLVITYVDVNGFICGVDVDEGERIFYILITLACYSYQPKPQPLIVAVASRIPLLGVSEKAGPANVVP